jgi:hypothetical protein
MNLYGYPKLMKAGLGNMLLPWANCYLWCYDNNAKMIAPFWFKLRIGPYLRQEKDKRQYQKLFNSKKYVNGFERLYLLTKIKVIDNEYFDLNKSSVLDTSIVVKFTSMECMDSLVGRQDIIKYALYDMIYPEYLPKKENEKFIAIHVRLGDYAKEENNSKNWLSRISIDYYVSALKAVRINIENDLKAIVFSDGSDNELSKLLSMENVVRSNNKEAITDLLTMADASILIGSCSTFSMWAAYLSQAPTIWHFKRKPANVFGSLNDDSKEIEWEVGKDFAPNFVSSLISKIDSVG